MPTEDYTTNIIAWVPQCKKYKLKDFYAIVIIRKEEKLVLFERIFRELNSNRVKYLVIGGIAVNLHGFSRATGDLDIMISFEEENVSRFIKTIKHLNLKPRVSVKVEDFADSAKRNSWIKEKNMKVFSLHNLGNPMEELDVILENDINFNKAYESKDIVKAGSIKIPILSINQLIKQKQNVGRERDTLDVKTLKKIRELKRETKKK